MTSAVIVAFMLVCGATGWALGSWKGKPLLGTFIGVMLGPLGWILMLTYPSQRHSTPQTDSADSVER